MKKGGYKPDKGAFLENLERANGWSTGFNYVSGIRECIAEIKAGRMVDIHKELLEELFEDLREDITEAVLKEDPWLFKDMAKHIKCGSNNRDSVRAAILHSASILTRRLKRDPTKRELFDDISKRVTVGQREFARMLAELGLKDLPSAPAGRKKLVTNPKRTSH